MLKTCASALSLCLLSACGSPTAPSGSLAFSTLARTEVAGSAGPQLQTVVRDAGTWSRVWSDLWGDLEPALPPVDFGREMVVIVTGSEICFGGAEVEEIVPAGGELRIRYGDAAPSSCLCIQPALSFHAVSAALVAGEPRFTVRQTPPLCPA